MLKQLFADAFTHWRTTLVHFALATLGVFATTQNLDKLTAGQAAMAFGAAALMAIKGMVTADARNTK